MIKYIKNNLSLFAKGLAIGASLIIPGVSGGTIAFLLKIYDQILEAITGLRRHFKQSILFLLPLVIGIIVAVISLIFPINWAFKHLPLPLISLFAGFIVGSIPFLFSTIKGKFNVLNISFLIIALLIAALLGVFSIVANFDASGVLLNLSFGHVVLIFFVGALTSSALIMPGLSGSMMLLVLGFYLPLTTLIQDLLSSLAAGTLFSNWTPILVMIIFAVGLMLGFFLISNLMKYLLNHHRIATFFVVFGFILGSLISLYLNNEMYPAYQGMLWWHIPVSIVLLILGTFISYLISSKGNKKEKEEIIDVGI